MKKKHAFIVGFFSLAFIGLWLPTALKQEKKNFKRDMDDLFLASAHAGKYEQVKNYLKIGAFINAVDDQGRTALHLIALRERPQRAEIRGKKIFFIFINQSAKIKKEMSDPEYKLREAAYYQLANFLIEHGINIHHKDRNNQTAGDLAREYGDGLLSQRILDAMVQQEALPGEAGFR